MKTAVPTYSCLAVAVALGSGYRVISARDILYCVAEGNNTHIHLKDGQQLTSGKNIKQIFGMLSQDDFVRIHHSYVVNLEHVLRLTLEPEMQVELRDGSRILVSRRKKKDLLEHYLIL
ncbi:MAG: LytTR family DNA-binding domain-containing protein [Saprospiraceae bacterium]